MTGVLPCSSCCGLRLGAKIDVSQVSSRSFDNVKQIDAAQLVELINRPACSNRHAFGVHQNCPSGYCPLVQSAHRDAPVLQVAAKTKWVSASWRALLQQRRRSSG